MNINFPSRPNFGAIGRRYRRETKKAVVEKLSLAITQATETIIERTPVYTGKTLRNFRWSVGAPYAGVLPAISKGGLPGKTSKAPLGSEIRREPNAEDVRTGALDVITDLQRNPFQDIFLVNNHDNYFRVEYGTYSENSRTPPGGITRAAEIKITVILEGMK